MCEYVTGEEIIESGKNVTGWHKPHGYRLNAAVFEYNLRYYLVVIVPGQDKDVIHFSEFHTEEEAKKALQEFLNSPLFKND